MNWKLNSIIVMVFMLLLTNFSARAETTVLPKEDGALASLEQEKKTDTIFKYEKKDRENLIQLRGSGNNRHQSGDDTGTFGIEALAGHLFDRFDDQFAGYYFLSGKLESDNRQRFNATLGYFLPVVGGETKITYRLLHAEVKDTLKLSDGFELLLNPDYEESALEQGLGFNYKKRINIVIRELSFRYAYTHLGGESVENAPLNLDSPSVWRRVIPNIGFGDVDTHEASMEISTGSDFLENPFFKGVRLDLGSGYQNVTYGSFNDLTEITDKGFSGSVALKACTSLGMFKAGYQDSPAAKVASGGYQLGGLDFFYKNIDYEYGDNEQILGVSLTVDMLDTDAALDRNCPRFFYSSDVGYTNVSQMEHVAGLASDQFTAKPVIRVTYKDLYRIDKEALPNNVRVDDSDPGKPKLVVSTSCPQANILSVEPPSATSAFGISGMGINVDLAGLPSGQRTIVAKFDDKCCGDTQVSITTSEGSLAVTSVNVKEGVGCQQATTESLLPQDPSQPSQPSQCLSFGTICNAANDTCCAGTSCQFAYNTSSQSIYLCQ